MATKNKEEVKVAVETKPEMSAEELADLQLLREAQGAGRQNVNAARDMQIPFLEILQSGSPQLKRGNAKYIKEAQQGDILNTVTGKLYTTYEPDGKPLVVTVVDFVPQWIEWKLRHLGGGFIKAHKDEMVMAQTVKGGPKGKDDVLRNNPEHAIVPTASYAVLVEDPDGRYLAAISMKSSQLKKSRKWQSQIAALKDPRDESIVLPSFYSQWELSTALEEFAEGSAYGWVIKRKEKTPALIFREALQQFKTVQSTPALMASVPPSDLDGEDDPSDIPTERPGQGKGPF